MQKSKKNRKTKSADKIDGVNWSRAQINMAQIFDRITKLIDGGRLPPTILFEGHNRETLREVAASTCAKFYCENENACGQCALCLEVMRIQHQDIFWLETGVDEATIKINQAHEFAEHLAMKASSGARRVGARVGVIVDAEKLSIQAANALLKAFEDSAENSYVILTSTKPRLILETILSRCVQWPLRTKRNESNDPNGVERSLQHEALLLKLCSAPRLSEVLVAAEELAKKAGLSAARLVMELEIYLNQAYKRSDHNLTKDYRRVVRRRQQLHELKLLAVQNKIAINATMAGEALGLGL